MIGYLTSKAKPQRGGVFLWTEDWDAIVRQRIDDPRCAGVIFFISKNF